jgi:hypothetical protein
MFYFCGLKYFLQKCFILRSSDSTVSEDAWLTPAASSDPSSASSSACYFEFQLKTSKCSSVFNKSMFCRENTKTTFENLYVAGDVCAVRGDQVPAGAKRGAVLLHQEACCRAGTEGAPSLSILLFSKNFTYFFQCVTSLRHKKAVLRILEVYH